MNVNEQLAELFVDEAQETLADFEQALLLLESLPDDAELTAKLFRCVHTLKGNSRILAFDNIERFSHELESLLNVMRSGELVVTHAVTDALLLCLDVLKDLVADVAGRGAYDAARYDAALRKVTTMLREQGAAAYEESIEVELEAEPSLIEMAISQIPPKQRNSLPEAAQRFSLPEPELHSHIAHEPQEEPRKVDHFTLSPPAAPAPMAAVPARSRPAQPAISEAPPPMPANHNAPAPVAAAAPVELTKAAATPAPVAAVPIAEVKKERKPTSDAESSSVRVPIDKLDRLINLTGEVVIAQSIIAQLVTDLTPDRVSQLQEVVAQMDRHCRELQERMLGARMLPLRNVFTRFQRLVRDLSGTTGKSLRLEVGGEETELDKTVIEKIADPLTHIIRNAVDHGIETPEERTRSGKPAQACVKLDAYQKGGSIFIEVSDDGRGINREKVLAKAVSSGLVRAGVSLNDEEIFALIFQPGFSTADKVTELSGRGVGMDVVKRNVEALKGSITITSKPGEGTCFRIKLPLTLAILDGLGLRVGSQVYLVPLVSVAESLQPKASEVHMLPEVGEVVDVRGEYLPLVRLHGIFDIEPSFRRPEEGLVMVLDDGAQKIALLIDELLGQYQVVIKSLEANFQAIPGIAGATVLGDGRVALILDTGNLRTLRQRSERVETTGNDIHLTASESAA